MLLVFILHVLSRLTSDSLSDFLEYRGLIRTRALGVHKQPKESTYRHACMHACSYSFIFVALISRYVHFCMYVYIYIYIYIHNNNNDNDNDNNNNNNISIYIYIYMIILYI